MSTARKSCYVFEYRITFIGAERVGKSAIIHQFIQKEFLKRYTPTSEDHMTYVVEHKGNMCVCLLVDTAGNDDFPAMRKLALTKGNIFVVVYSIDNEKSFIRAKHHVREIKNVKDGKLQEVKIMLVGNKVDLPTQREVTYIQGHDYAEEINEDNIKASFVEVTAKNHDSVSELLTKLLGMFNVPSMVEVPVLQEKKVMLSKLRKSTRMSRKSKKGKLSRKITHPIINNNENEKIQRCLTSEVSSASDGEILDDVTDMFRTYQQSKEAKMESFRKRSQSIPNAKLSCSRPSSPLSYVDAFKTRSGSMSAAGSRSDISSPTLVNHSGTLHRYNKLEPSRSFQSDFSSDDSGLSDDCPSACESSSPQLHLKQSPSPSPTPGSSLEARNAFTSGRRPSLSDLMKGMFKRAKSVIDT